MLLLLSSALNPSAYRVDHGRAVRAVQPCTAVGRAFRCSLGTPQPDWQSGSTTVLPQGPHMTDPLHWRFRAMYPRPMFSTPPTEGGTAFLGTLQ